LPEQPGLKRPRASRVGVSMAASTYLQMIIAS